MKKAILVILVLLIPALARSATLEDFDGEWQLPEVRGSLIIDCRNMTLTVEWETVPFEIVSLDGDQLVLGFRCKDEAQQNLTFVKRDPDLLSGPGSDGECEVVVRKNACLTASRMPFTGVWALCTLGGRLVVDFDEMHGTSRGRDGLPGEKVPFTSAGETEETLFYRAPEDKVFAVM